MNTNTNNMLNSSMQNMKSDININDLVNASFKKIAPFWPLKNLIAVNPLQGFEDLPIEEALKMAKLYFEQENLPEQISLINRETIKWLQIYFDEGQATISMPFKERGLYFAWSRLAIYDENLHKNAGQNKKWLKHIQDDPEKVIIESLQKLDIATEEAEIFLTILLTTLSGWSSYIKYCTQWSRKENNTQYLPITEIDYIALRLSITTLLWPKAKDLIKYYYWQKEKITNNNDSLLNIEKAEKSYQLPLIKKLATRAQIRKQYTADAQLIFCIDVRSEPFRRALESVGDYHTLGFAGFFGIPLSVNNLTTGEKSNSCPVLLSPQHEVKEYFFCKNKKQIELDQVPVMFKRLYQSAKYAFVTPFVLVEILGIFSALWMMLRSLLPSFAFKIKKFFTSFIRSKKIAKFSIDDISLQQQYLYAEKILTTIGLTDNFASLVVLCAHGSSTQNNAYASLLDCGACGGRSGLVNARVLAAIMNNTEVRKKLADNGIIIPKNTYFLAAEHNTTTDEVTILNHDIVDDIAKINKLKKSLLKARNITNLTRIKKMGEKVETAKEAVFAIKERACDWAQVRPEWGLALNSAFIVAPRELSSSFDLESRCFLHSYDYKIDNSGDLLTSILTAPMIVAHWINMQYLFSTLNNISYGGGSKITKNITGKIGVMQGNASDLMTGLPLQSVYISDSKVYHEPQRLMTIVLAPLTIVDNIIKQQEKLKSLFRNGWAQISVIDPETKISYLLNRELTWQKI